MARSHTKIKSKDNILDYIYLLFSSVLLLDFISVFKCTCDLLQRPDRYHAQYQFYHSAKVYVEQLHLCVSENNLFEPFAMSIVRTLVGTLTGVAATAMVAYVMF